MATMSVRPAPTVQQATARPSRRWLLGTVALAGLCSVGSWQATLHQATSVRPAVTAPDSPSGEPAFTVYLVGSAEQAALLRRAVGDDPATDVLLADTPTARAAAQRTFKDIRLGLADQPIKVVDLTRP